MEPGVTEFLRRVGMTIGLALVWLTITVVAALKNDNAFVEGRVRIANVLFYIWFVISMVLVVKLMKKIWNKKFDITEDDI